MISFDKTKMVYLIDLARGERNLGQAIQNLRIFSYKQNTIKEKLQSTSIMPQESSTFVHKVAFPASQCFVFDYLMQLLININTSVILWHGDSSIFACEGVWSLTKSMLSLHAVSSIFAYLARVLARISANVLSKILALCAQKTFEVVN